MSRKKSNDGDVKLKDKEDIKIQKPKKYKVVFHNDDFTPMDYVAKVLIDFFNKGTEEAIQITYNVHEKGKGIAGVYSKEIAETKSEKTNFLSKSLGFPLLTTIEPE